MKPETLNDAYHGLLGLDKLPRRTKIINVVVCFLLVVFISIIGFFHINGALLPNETPLSYYGVALVSPCCIAVAWLRLTGVQWRIALLLFILTPVAFLGILFLYGLMVALFMAT